MGRTKIERMGVRLVAVPLDEPLRTDRCAIDAIYHALVTLRSDGGREAFGYGLLLDARQAKALANGLIAEYVPWSERLFVEPLRREKGRIRLPERPGIRLEVDWAAVEGFAVR
jgi:hypothetical protein